MGSSKNVFGLAILGVLGAPAFAPGAGAVEAPQTSPLSCTFDVTPKNVQAYPATVAVDGTAPEGSTVKVFVDGAAVSGATAVVGSNWTFHFDVSLTKDSDVSVNYFMTNGNAYATGCADVAGEVVIRVRAEVAALAFTGSSSNTSTSVLAGVAAVALGLLLVVGVRRRSSVRG